MNTLGETVDYNYLKQRKTSFMRVFGWLMVILASGCALISFLIINRNMPVHPDDDVIGVLILSNLASVLILFVMIIARFYRIWRVKVISGSTLNGQISTLFAIVAVMPTVIVSIFAVYTININFNNWFSTNVREIISASQNLAKQTLASEMADATMAFYLVMTGINDIESDSEITEQKFVSYLNTQANLRSLKLLAIINGDGEIIAASDHVDFKPPEQGFLAQAKEDSSPVTGYRPDITEVRVLQKISSIDDRYLYLISALNKPISNAIQNIAARSQQYDIAQQRMANTELALALTYLVAVLVMLLAAIWVGINFAERLTRPLQALMQAAHRISGGRYDVQVPVNNTKQGDIYLLLQAFNTMASKVRSQRDDLVEARDQTDSKRRFTEAVLSGVSAGIIGVRGNEGIITMVNGSAQKLLQRQENGLINYSITSVMPEISTLLDKAYAEPTLVHSQHITMQRDNRELHLSVRITREITPAFAQSNLVVTIDDISDLISAQRSSAWADIARRIAHEIKNPLTPIQLAAERLRRRYKNTIGDDDEVFNQCTNTIIKHVGDIGRMVDEFSSFTRMPKANKKINNLSQTINEVITLIRVGKPWLTVNLDLPKERLDGMFDERLITQALTNILKNAEEAILAKNNNKHKNNGTITIQAFSHKDEFIINITDNGIGLPPNMDHNRLFEPYVTTRAKGTGLGLAIVSKIMEEHDGYVKIVAAEDNDTTGTGTDGTTVSLVFANGLS